MPWTNRRARIVAVGTAAFVLGARAARLRPVSARELHLFRLVNGLPARAFGPVWAVMQLGSLAGVATAATGAAVARRPVLARRLAAAGTLAWVAAKVAKQPVQRGRPTVTVEVARVLGNEQAGLGYPSGHAAVAATLYFVAEPVLPARWRTPAATVAVTVGMARVYVGAHLPLDVLGGLALGAAIGAGSQLSVGTGQAPMSTPS